MILDHEEDRVLQSSMRNAAVGVAHAKRCLAGAIEILIREKQIAIFGPVTSTGSHCPCKGGHLHWLWSLRINVSI